MTKFLSIIHFNPIEQYPPVMNFLNYLVGKNINIVVCTMHSHSTFTPFKSTNNITIKRFGNQESKRSIVRLFNYSLFYFYSTYFLIKYKTNDVLYYETNSYLPIIIYDNINKIFGKMANIYCHYHEYTSPYEYIYGMKISNWLHKLEVKNYRKMQLISHTNKQRLELFKNDLGLNLTNLEIFANYPPQKWVIKGKVKVIESLPLKIVYVGALCLTTMYVKEFAQWISKMNGHITWDIFTQQKADSTINYLNGLKTPFINIRGFIEYNNLPSILHEYDLGVILYKGHTLNHIHSETNKLFEYLGCGLSVWYSNKISGIDSHKCNCSFPKVISLDFENLNETIINNILIGCSIRYLNYNCENECEKYLKLIYKNKLNYHNQ